MKPLPLAEFEELVADALDEVPAELASAIDNVAVFVADWPTAEQQRSARGTLLGLYEGVPLTRRDPTSYAGVTPDRITIFRGPLCAHAADEGARADFRVRVDDRARSVARRR